MSVYLLPKRAEVLRTINEFSDEQFQELSVFVEFLQQHAQKPKTTKRTASEILRQKLSHYSFHSAEEVDQFLNMERDSWD